MSTEALEEIQEETLAAMLFPILHLAFIDGGITNSEAMAESLAADRKLICATDLKAFKKEHHRGTIWDFITSTPADPDVAIDCHEWRLNLVHPDADPKLPWATYPFWEKAFETVMVDFAQQVKQSLKYFQLAEKRYREAEKLLSKARTNVTTARRVTDYVERIRSTWRSRSEADSGS